MELKDVKFETVGEAAKVYPQSTLVIRKQFFDGVVARFQDAIKTRTEMFIDEQKIRVEIGQELQKEYHKTFELKEQIRKQKYRRCLARSKISDRLSFEFKELFHDTNDDALLKTYNQMTELHRKWCLLWLKASEQYKQPLEFIEKDLETL